MSASNAGVQAIKDRKRNEFYTPYSAIKDELESGIYKSFSGQTVYANCDNPLKSNFTLYFLQNFAKLGLKRLISTGYNPGGYGYKLDVTEPVTGDITHYIATHTDRLSGNGDFRSDECLNYLKQADIVVTNPPFTFFRALFDLLIDQKKKFIILGDHHAATYNDVLTQIMYGDTKIGKFKKQLEFRVPDDYDLRTGGSIKGKHKYVKEHVRWYSNVITKWTPRNDTFSVKYDPKLYPKYPNYDIIEVSKMKDLPVDYNGIMGVPVSFLDFYDPDKFKLLGKSDHSFAKRFITQPPIRWVLHRLDGSTATRSDNSPYLRLNKIPKNHTYLTKADDPNYIIKQVYQRFFIKWNRKR